MEIDSKVYFTDRVDAARALHKILPIDNMKLEKWIVVSTSANGVPIAYELSKTLQSSFDLMYTQKVFAPNNPECEVAIVTETEEVVIHEELVRNFEINLDTIFDEAKSLYRNKIVTQLARYRKSQALVDMYQKNVLLVDEGLNTGLTMMACIKTAINLGARSVSVAVPVLPKASVPDIESIADDLYYAKKVSHFVTIDFYYENLSEVSMEKVKNIINKG